MSKDQGARRYLDIPGEKTLIYTFKFNMDLPAPVPPPKTMYIPLDPERYIKPKLTLFHVKRKANLLADINLSIPVDEINMRPELYNPAPDAKFELTEKDRELLEEKPTVKKEETPAKGQSTNGKPQTAGQKDKDAAAKAQPSTKAKPDAAQSKKPEAAQAPKKKEEAKKLSIDEYVKKTFEVSSTYTTGMKHPTKEGLQCQEVFEIIPDFNNIITELYTVKAEVSAETIKSKENIIKFETDLDKKPIVGLYVSAPLGEGTSGMEEEKEEGKESDDSLLKRVENFEHFGNYNYSNPKPHGSIKRDLLLNVNKANGKALIYQPHSLILKKKKVLFMTKTVYNKDEDMEEEKKPKEKKRTIKILKRNLDKDELLLKKKKFKELQLENTAMYKKNNKDIESYKEPEEDELDVLRKRFAVEEEEEEENQGEEEEKVEEEEEAGYDEEDKGSNVDRGSEREEEKDERNEPMEEEAQYNEEEKEQKPAKAGSEDGDAQELADFFADSDDDEDD